MINLLKSEGGIRLSLFLVVFIIMSIWEIMSPKRKRLVSKRQRWFTNLSIIFINMVFVRFTLGAFAYTVAIFSQLKGWGLFNYLETDLWISVVISIIILDFPVYLQHIIVHAVPLFWRLHRIHHTDLELDVSSGLRFHPLEIFLSLLYKSIIVIVLGAPAIAVLIFEVILSATSLFNHGNVAIPKSIDTLLRYIIVTPDMHRIYHSTIMDEINSNFGFSVSWWDRICGTYKKTSSLGQLKMEIGLKEFRNQNELRLFDLFTLPFHGKMGQ